MKVEMLETFLTGHPEIDNDHRKLIDLINLVDEAISGEEYNECKQLLDSFVDFARGHFEREEKILIEIGFPDAQSHCAYHEEMLDRAENVKNLCREMRDQGQIQECFEEMSSFLVDDIVRGDSAFVSYMIEKGIVRA